MPAVAGAAEKAGRASQLERSMDNVARQDDKVGGEVAVASVVPLRAALLLSWPPLIGS